MSKVDKTYSVFLSYNSEDRDCVQKIAVYLADEAMLKPWFDQWALVPGQPWVRNLESGLAASLSCAVFIGKSGEGPWQLPEVEAALREQAKNQSFRVIPVLLPDASQKPKLPTFLSGNIWVDFRKGPDDDSLWRLECGIRGVPPGPGRPHLEHQLQVNATSEPVCIESVRVNIPAAERSVNVFISYRHSEPDNSLAQVFADVLKKAGHEVFIDTGLRWGSDWAKGIREALERADFLLLLLSQDSGASEMVVREVALARELAHQRNGTPVILPVRLNLPFTEPLPYQLEINLYNIHQELWNASSDTPRLVNQLLSTVVQGNDWSTTAPAVSTPFKKQVGSLQPQFDPRSLIIPGGSVEADSRFYIMREADNEVFNELQKPRATVTVRGPRQTGKTSLIMGMYVALKRTEKRFRTVFIDFQALQDKDLKSLDTIWCAIAARIAKQIQVERWRVANWRFDDSYDSNISTFLDKFVFAEEETPLLICLDEVDRLFHLSINSSFFASVRAFFNLGAFDPSWKRIRWLLSSSSEPSFFINDITQSPFNIGLRVELGAFTQREIETFAGRHGLTLDQSILKEVERYVGGRPYLIHLMFYHLVRNPEAWAKLFDVQVSSRGIFRDHLHSYLVQFQREKALAQAMKDIIKGIGCGDAKLVARLEAAGLVRQSKSMKAIPACRLYAEFFANELK